MRVILIRAKFENSWTSCQHLLNGLISLYKYTYPNLEILEIEDSREIIFRERPDIIILADQQLLLPSFLKLLSPYFGQGIKWVWHIYGDFVSRIFNNFPLKSLLQSESLLVVAGSESHRKMVSKFFKNPSVVSCLPFPANFDFKASSQEERDAFTKKLDVTTSSRIFMFSGRISFHKNIVATLELFTKFARKDDRFIICGAIDFGHERFSADSFIVNYTADEFFQLVAQDERIHYLGNFNQDELNLAYEASHCLINLTTFDMEDFGLACIEALIRNTSVIATKWGGIIDLQKFPSVALLDLSVNSNEILLSDEDFRKAMDKISTSKRVGVDQAVYENFHYQELSHRLRPLIESDIPPFEGFSEFTIKFIKRSIGLVPTKEHLLYNLDLYEPYFK